MKIDRLSHPFEVWLNDAVFYGHYSNVRCAARTVYFLGKGWIRGPYGVQNYQDCLKMVN